MCTALVINFLDYLNSVNKMGHILCTVLVIIFVEIM